MVDNLRTENHFKIALLDLSLELNSWQVFFIYVALFWSIIQLEEKNKMDTTQFNFHNFKEAVLRLVNSDPEFLIYEYFENFKRQVDLRREKLFLKIEQGIYEPFIELKSLTKEEFVTEIADDSDKLIQLIIKTQAECMEAGKSMERAFELERVERELKEISEMKEVPALELKVRCDKLIKDCQKQFLNEEYEFVIETNYEFISDRKSMMGIFRIKVNLYLLVY